MANCGTAALAIACLLVAVTMADAVPPVSVSPHLFCNKVHLFCNKVHGVHERETCFTVAQAAGLTLKQFLGFNPNVNCQNLFIGQWVCLDAIQVS